MAILFAGTSLVDFTSYSSTAVEVTNPTYFDSAYVTEAFRPTNGGSATASIGSRTEVWVKYRFQPFSPSTSMNGFSGGTIGDPFFAIRNGTTNVIYARRQTDGTNGNTWTNSSGGSYQLYSGAGSSMVGFNVSGTARTEVVIYLKVASVGGILQVWKDEVQQLDYTGDTRWTGATSIDNIWFGASQTGQDTYVSEVLATDYDLRSNRLVQLPVQSAGAQTGWTGGYADVIPPLSDDTRLRAEAANLTSTFVIGDVPVIPELPKVAAVITSVRVRRGQLGPQGMQHIARVGGVDYSKAVTPGLTLSGSQCVWDTNPATEAEWGQTAVNNLEIGVKSVS
jgi:hypothetical protein